MKILVVNGSGYVDTVAENIVATEELRNEKARYLAGETKYYTGDYAIYKDGKISGYVGHLSESNSTVYDVAVVPEDIFKDDGNGGVISYKYVGGIFTKI